MKIGKKMIGFAVQRPKTITITMVIVTLILASLISLVKVDTDPENMLSPTEPVRIFHNQVKKDFDLYDVVVLGIVNETDPDGVFNPKTLGKISELTDFIRTLTWPDPKDPQKTIGVIKRNLITPANVDSIEQDGPGQIKFSWLMQTPPKTRAEALKIRDLTLNNPLLNDTLVSRDGRALALYIPLSSKDLAYKIKRKLEKKIADFSGSEQYYITGLPVAEDTFGVEMFIQMAVSAPVAMLLIFLLMLYFFRQPKLIAAPMIIAMVSVLCTMGLLIGTGNTLHIMSSMIPIFLMPVAVVDSIHILSEFFDRYQKTKDREATIKHVMSKLFAPMLYTSLTSAAGFFSLALTPIPPVQVFGLYVGFGICLAWVLTMLFVPAYVMLLKESSLKNFGAGSNKAKSHKSGFTDRLLTHMSKFTYNRAKLILVLSLLIMIVSGYGITLIKINDNPVKWFTKSHPIRVADRVLNNHFGGTYEAYLVIDPAQSHPKTTSEEQLQQLKQKITGKLTDSANDQQVLRIFNQVTTKLSASLTPPQELLKKLARRLRDIQDQTEDDNLYDAWSPILKVVENELQARDIFKSPAVLRYIDGLQQEMNKHPMVGKSNSIVQVVKKVHQELLAGNPREFKIPDRPAAVAQCLISFQNSHKPDDLWHLVTPNYRRANIWVQLHSGDNQDMEEVIKIVHQYIAANPPPIPLQFNWAGLTYINVVWQNKMVAGMLRSLMGSFVIVLIMMVILFRSPLWGLLAMIPLTLTITLIYGIIGLIGKDYDMPVAVLSSLTLGLAVDFAIHFLERSRMTYKECGSWQETISIMFAEPARAITRNIIVIAVGFTPLILAPLMPYKTVGIFLASIMLISGLATIIILPALLALGQNFLFRKLK